MRELLFAVMLALGCAAIVVGVASVSAPAAWIVGGVLLIIWSWLTLGDLS